jgi:hypothetical protein
MSRRIGMIGYLDRTLFHVAVRLLLLMATHD